MLVYLVINAVFLALVLIFEDYGACRLRQVHHGHGEWLLGIVNIDMWRIYTVVYLHTYIYGQIHTYMKRLDGFFSTPFESEFELELRTFSYLFFYIHLIILCFFSDGYGALYPTESQTPSLHNSLLPWNFLAKTE